MTELRFSLDEVRYNPSFEVFEALAIFETKQSVVKVPTSFAAPITSDFEFIARGLQRKAMRALNSANTPRSLQVFDHAGEELQQAA